MENSELHVRSGALIALRLFDVAYSIDIRRAGFASREPAPVACSAEDAITGASSLETTRVLLSLDPVMLNLGGRSLSCDVTARLYDFGVASLAVRIPLPEMGWREFTEFSNSVDHLAGPSANGGFWQPVLEKLQSRIAPALMRPNGEPLQESHLIAVVHEWNQPVIGEDLSGRVDLTAFFAEGDRPLSKKTREEMLRHRFSYYEDDLIVITGTRTFIYESQSVSKVTDVIEAANVQLLEFRYYNQLLDEELPRMHGLVREIRSPIRLISSRRFANLARNLYRLVAEVTELSEKAENTLRITGDPHLGRIYKAALQSLSVPSLSAALDRKLAIIRDTYNALYEEASGARAELLELAIILLIALEIVITVMRHGE